MRILTILFCCFLFNANAQKAASDQWDTADNSPNTPNENNDFHSPIGLDLMGGSANGVTIFPNPSNDHIVISVAGKPSDKKAIVIANSFGKEVFKMGNRRENTFMVDVSGLKNDIYFIQVISGNHIYRKKWAKRS